jgi:hypothetical protein
MYRPRSVSIQPEVDAVLSIVNRSRRALPAADIVDKFRPCPAAGVALRQTLCIERDPDIYAARRS